MPSRSPMRLALALCLLAPAVRAQTLDADSLRADLDVLRRTLVATHPALDVYGQRAEVEALISDSAEALRSRDSVSLAEAFLAVARIVGAVRDGHTVLNPLNQSEAVQQALWNGRTVLPFTFRIVDDRLVVTRDVSGGWLPRGTEVLALDGVLIPAVLDALLPFSTGDGRGTDALRRARLAVSETEVTERGWPLFDLLYPLVFPPARDEATLTVRTPTGSTETVRARRITRDERLERLAEAGVGTFDDERAWETRRLDAQTGYVRLGSFLSYRFSTPADTLLARTVRQLREDGATRLLLDVRGVGGGTLGYETVARYFTTQTVPCGVIDRVAIAADRIDPTLFPYLSSWSDEWKQPLPPEATAPLPDGRFELRGAASCPRPAPSAARSPSSPTRPTSRPRSCCWRTSARTDWRASSGGRRAPTGAASAAGSW